MSADELKDIRNTLRMMARANLPSPHRGRKRASSPPRRAGGKAGSRASSPHRKAGGRTSSPLRGAGKRGMSPTRRAGGRTKSPSRNALRRQRSPSPDDQKIKKIYCIYCKRKTKTHDLVLKQSSNNRNYYSGECDICHKRKSQFV